MGAEPDDSWITPTPARSERPPPTLSAALADAPVLVVTAPRADEDSGAWRVHALGALGDSLAHFHHQDATIDLARRACESTPEVDLLRGAELTALPWSIGGQRGAVMLANPQDLSERWPTLERVRATLRRLSAASAEARACSALGEGLLIADDRGRLTTATERAAALLGVPRAELEGRPLGAVMAETCRVLIAFDRLELGEQITLRTSTRHGEQIALSATRHLAPDGEPEGVIVRLTPSGAIAPIARRRDRQVAAIRHEIRAPLTVLRGVTAMLREEPEMELADRMTFLASLERETGRVITMVEDLLTRARLRTGTELSRRTSVELRAWAIETVAGYDEWCRAHDHEISLTLPPPSPSPLHVLADRGLLDSLGRSVFGHIFKSAPPGARVTFSLDADIPGEVSLRWSDDGPLLGEGERAQLFTSFRRSTAAGKYAPGGGVGLPVAKEIADAHGWGMTYERSGEGRNLIWVRLPLEPL